MRLAETAKALAKFDAKLTYRTRGAFFGYPRTREDRLWFPPDYLRLLDRQLKNLEKRYDA